MDRRHIAKSDAHLEASRNERDPSCNDFYIPGLLMANGWSVHDGLPTDSAAEPRRPSGQFV